MIQPGQTFESNDPRISPRKRIRVVTIQGTHAVCEDLSTKKVTRIKLTNLGVKRQTGYGAAVTDGVGGVVGVGGMDVAGER